LWFVPLQELADPALIPGAIIDGLGLPRATDADPLEQATVFLSRQPSLLVVDNLEHLLEEGVAPLVTLLGRVPHLTCLATSRQPLGVSGEQELLVAPLPTPAADTAPEALIECPSVQLFVDRAQSARPDFQVTARNAEAVAELCNRLEGIPLAVELAAARTRALTPAQMLAHMGDRFALLVSRRRGVPDRHRTLWAAIDWSYQLLAPELRRFFARLSIFRGGWTAEAAQAVCRESRAAEYLERLVEASLVSAEPGDEALGMRFAMFETLREYGDGKLLAREREPLTRRHAEYCTTLVTEASREWQGPAGGIWFRRVEADYANIRQALAWLQRIDQATATELALVAGTKAFWDTRRDWEEGLAYDSAALARCGSEVSINRWRICNNAANLAGAVGRRALARSFAEQGMELARQLHHDGAMAGALYRAADFADDLAVKRQLIAEALRIARRTHDHDGLVSGLGRVAGLMEAQGQWQKARALLTRILALQRERGMGLGVASALEGLARIARAERDYTRGRELLRESLAIHRELGIQPHVVPTLAELSLLAHFDGDLDEARALGEEALEGARAVGHKREIRGALRNLSNVARQQGDCPAARALIEESLSLSRELRDNWWISMGLYCLGLVALQEGDHRAAYSALAESLTLRRQSNDMPYIAFTLEGFAALYAAQGRAPLAAQLLGAAEGVREAAPVPVLPPELRDAERETALETVRAALSDTEFAAEWAAGRAMGLDEAIRCALSPPDATPPAKPPRPRKRAPTRRRAPQP
jgi:predicted ATPase